MENVDTRTNHRMHTGEKMSLLEEEQASTTDWQDFGNGPNPCQFGTGRGAAGPSARSSSEDPKAFIRRILERGEAGIWLLKTQLQADKLPFNPKEMSSEETLYIVTAMLKHGRSGMELFELLVSGENPRMDLRRLLANDTDTLANKLLECGLVGIKYLADLIKQGKLPNFSSEYWVEQDLRILVERLILGGSDGMDLCKHLISEDKLPNIYLPNAPELLIDYCFSQGPSGISLLQVLMVKGKILNLDPSKFSLEEANAFVNKVLQYGQLGRDFVAELVKQGKFQSFASLEDNKASSDETNGTDSESWYSVCARQMSMTLEETLKFWQENSVYTKQISMFFEKAYRGILQGTANGTHLALEEARRIWQGTANGTHMTLEEDRRFWQTTVNEVVEQKDMEEAHRILKDGISRAFFGKADGIDDWAWANVRTRQSNMHLVEAREIWQGIANEVATACFDGDGHVNVKRLKVWMDFFGNAENFKEEPFCLIPHAELMRSQMRRICECLLNNQKGARDLLNAANGITVGRYGRSILDAMVQGGQPPLRPAEAILASLFTPHRQLNLPTCTINSRVNAEIRNHPERLIAMYEQMLTSDQFTFPSGYAIQQQLVVNSFITVDLRNGGDGRAKVFENIRRGDWARIVGQIARWRKEGIEYVESTDEAEKYKLRMPVRNMNDLLFAHLFQASNFGNRIYDDYEYGTRLIYSGRKYAGYGEYGAMYSSGIQVNGSKFLHGIAELQKQAKAQQKLGLSYMRVVTASSIGPHAENIDIDALLALDPHTMELGKAYSIVDRNWSGWGMSQDIPRLAVRKIDNTPTFEFGTLRGSSFEKTNMTRFWVYKDNVNVHNAQYWKQFRP